MLEKAFLFDIDGVLVASHELQATALIYVMKIIAKKHELDFQPNDELHSALLNILVGGTEETSIKKILETFPVFIPYKVELFSTAWEKYYQLAAEDKGFIIQESVDLLKLLREVGYKVCLVSNSKQKDIERYCKILGLDEIIKENLYVSFEDISGQAKPLPFPYLIAARKLEVAPQNCIVFEDSPNGIISAKRAGMYAVGLHRYPFSEILSHSGADEVVANVFDSKILSKAMYTSPDLRLKFNNIVMRIVTFQEMTQEEKGVIISSTYEIYRKLFTGRSLDKWRDKFVDNRDMLTRIGLFYADGELMGYGILKFREITYKDEQRVVSLLSVGLSENFREASLLFRFYQMEFRRFLVANFNKKNHMVDTFLSFGGYRLALRHFENVYPSISHSSVDPELFEYTNFLANQIGYTKAAVENPLVYLSTSAVKLSSEAKARLLASEDPHCKYFIAQTGLVEGHGLLSIAPVTLSNLRPFEQPNLRPIFINTTTSEKAENKSRESLQKLGNANKFFSIPSSGAISHKIEMPDKTKLKSKL